MNVHISSKGCATHSLNLGLWLALIIMLAAILLTDDNRYVFFNTLAGSGFDALLLLVLGFVATMGLVWLALALWPHRRKRPVPLSPSPRSLAEPNPDHPYDLAADVPVRLQPQ